MKTNKRSLEKDHAIATGVMQYVLEPDKQWWINKWGNLVHCEVAFSPTSNIHSALEVLDKIAHDQGHYLIENHPCGGKLVSVTWNGHTGTWISTSLTHAISEAVLLCLAANNGRISDL